MYNDFKGGKRLLIFQPGDLSIPERWEAIFFFCFFFLKDGAAAELQQSFWLVSAATGTWNKILQEN